MDKRFIQLIVPCLVLILWGGALYSNTLNSPFYLDDSYNIYDSQAIRIDTFSINSIRSVINDSFMPTRPIANLSFAVNYLLGGEKVFGYHVVNIFIHIITSLFVFFIINHILSQQVVFNDKDIAIISFLSALLWMSHPLHTQSITYIVQRMNSMSVMFILMSFYCYIRSRTNADKKIRIYLLIASVLLWLLAIGSKEIAAIFPFLIIAYEWYFNRNYSSQKRSILQVFLPVGLLCLFMLAWFYYDGSPFGRVLEGFDKRGFTLSERLLTESRVVIHYLSLFFYPDPSRLSLEYSFPVSSSVINPPVTLLAIILISTIIVLSVLADGRNKIFSFSIIWFFLCLVIESTFVALEIIFEHRTYLPTVFLSLSFVLLVYKCVEQNLVRYLVIFAVILFLSGATLYRNNLWSNPLEFWHKTLDIAPDSSRANNNYGISLHQNNSIDEAVIYYKKALELDQSNIRAMYNIGVAMHDKGFNDIAKQYMLKAMLFDIINDEVYNTLGMIYATEKDFQNALLYLNKAVDLSGDDPVVLSNIGNVYAETGNYQKALYFLQKSLKINSSVSTTHSNIGNVYVLLGRNKDAVSHYNEALRINPDNLNARNNLRIATRNLSLSRP